MSRWIDVPVLRSATIEFLHSDERQHRRLARLSDLFHPLPTQTGGSPAVAAFVRAFRVLGLAGQKPIEFPADADTTQHGS